LIKKTLTLQRPSLLQIRASQPVALVPSGAMNAAPAGGTRVVKLEGKKLHRSDGVGVWAETEARYDH
jgi:hypothetical protein